MPTQRIIDVYKFEELSAKAKEEARSWYREGALEDEWWDNIYEDAKRIGLKLIGFELDRGLNAEGEFIVSAVDCAEKILGDHGDTCKTYKHAKEFLATREDSQGGQTAGENDDVLETLNNDFLETILDDYAHILQEESEYLLSDENVNEMIIVNEYEFNKFGDRI